ncbi:methyltransferase [Candidatus Woesearchaeota archaeon]|nr:methyltransferase [Candidatus Woesearchaeota archaeon]USN44535.1 MAG: methyltransferase [Candidatus Woesearchaeota archaeon]
MIVKLPQITEDFLSHLEEMAWKGIVTYEVNGLKMEVFPFVFPPSSPFSDSSHMLYDFFCDVKGHRILDIGTGTGVQAIQAVRGGASYVLATDVFQPAIDCAKHNVQKHGLGGQIDIIYSDVFDRVPSQQLFHSIIANLPILDYCVGKESELCLFDPGFVAHQKLFSQAERYLRDGGRIVLVHADLAGKTAFTDLEELAGQHRFSSRVRGSVYSKGYEWRQYEFKR